MFNGKMTFAAYMAELRQVGFEAGAVFPGLLLEGEDGLRVRAIGQGRFLVERNDDSTIATPADPEKEFAALAVSGDDVATIGGLLYNYGKIVPRFGNAIAKALQLDAIYAMFGDKIGDAISRSI